MARGAPRSARLLEITSSNPRRAAKSQRILQVFGGCGHGIISFLWRPGVCPEPAPRQEGPKSFIDAPRVTNLAGLHMPRNLWLRFCSAAVVPVFVAGAVAAHSDEGK